MPVHFRRYRAALALIPLLLLAGCSEPAVPADAVAASPPAKPVTPVAGQCYEHPLHAAIMRPSLVDCAQPHRSEVAYVGLLGSGADTPPPAGSPPLADADASCRKEVGTFLGTPLGRRGATYEIGLPTEADWHDGARWYACEALVTVAKPGGAEPDSVQGSYAAGKNAPATHCYVLAKPKTSEGMSDVPCDQPHSAEFLAAVSPPYGSPEPHDDATWEPYYTACRDELAAQLGVPVETVKKNWGYEMYPAAVAWRTGTGTTMVQCYFVLWNAKKITGSILGTKGRGIPNSW